MLLTSRQPLSLHFPLTLMSFPPTTAFVEALLWGTIFTLLLRIALIPPRSPLCDIIGILGHLSSLPVSESGVPPFAKELRVFFSSFLALLPLIRVIVF